MDSFLYKSYYLPTAIGSFALVLLWSSGLSMVFILATLFALSLGYFFCHILLNSSHYSLWIQLVIANFVYGPEELLTNSEYESRSEYANKKKSSLTACPRDAQPWDNLRLNNLMNQELENLFETLIENYVNFWYTERISEDASFVLEIRHLLRYSSAKLIKCLTEANLNEIFVDELLPVIIAHVERICRFSRENFPDGIMEITHTPASVIELNILEKWTDPHWATLSQENQPNYLRSIADMLVCKFVDDIRIGGCFVDDEHQKMLDREGAISSATKWSCHSSRHFLRELIFSTVLLPTIDYFSDPDSLNRLTLSVINNRAYSPYEVDEESSAASSDHKVEFLAKFADQIYNHSPDTLLGIKLSDLIRDPYLVKLFDMYMRDLNGPLNYLDCFVQTRDIHMQIQKMDKSQRDRVKHEHEIHSDAWQLFSTFVHPNAQNHIPFKVDIVKKFSDFIEEKSDLANLKLLEQVIEGIYQQVYQYLQYNYVIPFCQSENYLGYLCGAPVDAVMRSEEGDTSMRKHTKIPEKSFSLTQFRKKLFNFIIPTKDPLPTNANTAFYPSLSTSDLEGMNNNDEMLIDTPLANFDSENGNIALCDMARDLNKWTTMIRGIEERRENATAKPYYVFSIRVERNDLPEDYFTSKTMEILEEENEDDEFDEKMPKCWTVGHRYEEFYALEEKLRAYYGNSLIRLPALPERKATLHLMRMSSQTRTLMESHRVQFERFLLQLLQQPFLKRSDLVYVFLKCEEDSSGLFELVETTEGSSFLPDLNPIRAMRNVAKGERGQNLKPFILNLLAKVLSPPTSARTTTISLQHQQLSYSPSFDSKESSVSRRLDEAGGGGDDRRSVSSLSIRNQRGQYLQTTNKSIIIPQGRINSQTDDEHGEPDNIRWKSNFYDLFLFVITTLGIFRIPMWLEAMLCSIRTFVEYIFTLIYRKKMDEILQQNVLNAETAIMLVRSLHELVLSSQNMTNPSSLSATPSQISVASSSPPLSTNKINRKQQLSVLQKTTTVAVSEQERHLRAELLLHCLEKRVEELLPCSRILAWLVNKIGDRNQRGGTGFTTPAGTNITAIHQLFLCFQMPLLNRQLSYTILDVIVQRIFIDTPLKRSD